MSEEAFQFLTIYFTMFTHYLDLFFKWFYSTDIHPFRFVSAFNRDCSICMDLNNCPGVFQIPGFCFVEYTVVLYKYFLTKR